MRIPRLAVQNSSMLISYASDRTATRAFALVYEDNGRNLKSVIIDNIEYLLVWSNVDTVLSAKHLQLRLQIDICLCL